MAPDQIIDSGPPNPTCDNTAVFTFHSTETGSTFQCKIDGGNFGACSSPKTYPGLSSGSHTVQIKATDPAGNTDPASYT